MRVFDADPTLRWRSASTLNSDTKPSTTTKKTFWTCLSFSFADTFSYIMPWENALLKAYDRLVASVCSSALSFTTANTTCFLTPSHSTTIFLFILSFIINDTYIFWALPSEDDFEPIDGQRLSGAPLRHLSPTMIQELHAKFLKLFSSLASPRFVNDPDI
ncbi:hypothetical protein BDP27DRAFT_1429264 [Rhodocollybia butyracea]|uniref:Uncharacterized protein n=1 Tax=Rhodocollybia butyracea TaxID=206335 RepID=A0A9P5U084_9AGAR|nr:hypothetical protein BDP27DRAFT_1429264 [Rhodocollybia butyracea]